MANIPVSPGLRRWTRSPEGRSKKLFKVGRVALGVLLSTVVLSSCLVNQTQLWARDKLSPSAPTTRVVTRANIPYGSDALQQLDLYLPAGPAIGIIIWFHSGGWCCGDKSGVDPLILSQVDRGYAVASVNYRLAPGVTAEQMLGDGDQAVRFIKANRSSWGAGAGKVIASGGSAGGTIALLLAAAPGYFAAAGLGPLSGIDPTVDAVISLVGPSDLRSYIEGSTGGWGPGVAEGFLGCSNLGSNWPTTTTTTTTTMTTTTTGSLSSRATVVAMEGPMPPCDASRVLKFSPVFWAVLTVFFRGSGSLPPAYLAYGDQDTLVPPSSQGIVLHDWWSAGGNWFATYYDNPSAGGHSLSYDVNATAFNLWLGLYGAP